MYVRKIRGYKDRDQGLFWKQQSADLCFLYGVDPVTGNVVVYRCSGNFSNGVSGYAKRIGSSPLAVPIPEKLQNLFFFGHMRCPPLKVLRNQVSVRTIIGLQEVALNNGLPF